MSIKLSEFKGIAFDLDDTLIDRKKAFDKIQEIMAKENEDGVTSKSDQAEREVFCDPDACSRPEYLIQHEEYSE